MNGFSKILYIITVVLLCLFLVIGSYIIGEIYASWLYLVIIPLLGFLVYFLKGTFDN